MLVHFERYEDIVAAITRERAMKEWRRDWKIELIAAVNPTWDDLYSRMV
jgi:putative endonuclease